MARGDILGDHLAAQVNERLIHIRPLARAGLIVGSIVPAVGDLEGAVPVDGAVIVEVRFVTHDHDGDQGVVFDADDLVAQFLQFGEGGEGGYGEDEEETLAGFHVEFAHRGCERERSVSDWLRLILAREGYGGVGKPREGAH